MVSITLPKKINEEIDAIIRVRYYDNRSELIRDALRLFFTQKKEIRLAAAIELYRENKITISRAAEIAGIPFDNMKSILEDEELLQRGRSKSKKSTKKLEKLVS